jgi:hypothetical protein
MKKPVKTKTGHVMCLTPGCNTRVPVRKNEATGALSFPCIECGAPSYAKNDGSEHYRNTMARLIPLAAPAAPAAPAALASPPPPARKVLFA